jgi:hypothetical protein
MKKTNEAPLGTGERFKQLSNELADKGASNPDALAAWIGRRKYGNKVFSDLSHHKVGKDEFNKHHKG